MLKTKIVCTLGPASNSPEMIEKMMLTGMNVARLNFSHGTHEEHKKVIDRIKEARERLGIPCAIMLDTKGPEIRLGKFEGGSAELPTGSQFTLVTSEIMGNSERATRSPQANHSRMQNPPQRRRYRACGDGLRRGKHSMYSSRRRHNQERQGREYPERPPRYAPPLRQGQVRPSLRYRKRR